MERDVFRVCLILSLPLQVKSLVTWCRPSRKRVEKVEKRSSISEVAVRMRRRKRMVNRAVLCDFNSLDCGAHIY
jgi:hypothetical protein